jgi:flagellar hook-basal body complex protein FliE
MDKIKLHTTIRPLAEPRIADKTSRKGVGEAQRFAETLKAELNRLSEVEHRTSTTATTPQVNAPGTIKDEISKAQEDMAKMLLVQRNLTQMYHHLHLRPPVVSTDDPDKA